ncbi:hypothetical protein CDCA_CDCA08G2395 [Cyanidium caldarium]|uniref:non-specific serine/threonine protein kinase n=1 Tax=Cyanidium caldarium TaxID=2771 RepID=A0AAV9IW92_CYACA|nr:hypothetical protein CDCA_CDCA08G2395 [Cyanidium caldarium]
MHRSAFWPISSRRDHSTWGESATRSGDGGMVATGSPLGRPSIAGRSTACVEPTTSVWARARLAVARKHCLQTTKIHGGWGDEAAGPLPTRLSELAAWPGQPNADSAVSQASGRPSECASSTCSIDAGLSAGTLPWVFQLIDKVGEGTFSVVFRASLLPGLGPAPEYAIKRLHRTNSEERIHNEIHFFMALHGLPRMPRLEGVFRYGDEVLIVTLYHAQESFRHLLPQMTVSDMRRYLRCLLEALVVLHERGVMHRDIKPSNFLFHRDAVEHAVLVDFGLAQRVPAGVAARQAVTHPSTATRSSAAAPRKATRKRTLDPDAAPSAAAASASRLGGDSKRRASGRRARAVPMNAPRAGTRGFRAPEVLFRSHRQDTKIDVWSAGVIFLSILSCRYPFFQAEDDRDAIAELAQLFGTAAMERAARACGREVLFPYRCEPADLRPMCERYRARHAHLTTAAAELPAAAFDLVRALLAPSCQERLTAREALTHPFFDEENAHP